jgi:hypothetical protein
VVPLDYPPPDEESFFFLVVVVVVWLSNGLGCAAIYYELPIALALVEDYDIWFIPAN